MVSCKHCNTQNSLDSTFCKRCGTAIDDAVLASATEKLEALIQEGNGLFNQGRTEEAMAVADAAVTSNPSSTAAWSLKALCHERKHQIAEALECAEKIVELNPDSELDKIKRNALRTRLQVDLQPVETPNKWVPWVGFVSAMVMVGSLGFAIARAQSTRDQVVANRSGGAVENFPSGMTGGGLPQTPTDPNRASTNPPANLQKPDPAGEGGVKPGPGDVPNIDNRNQQAPNPAGYGPKLAPYGGPLPDVNPSDPSRFQVIPEGAPEVVIPKSEKTVTKPDERRDDPPTLPPTGGPNPEQTKETQEDPMRGITIKVTRPKNNPADGGSSVIDSNGLEALLRVGSQQYSLGNYSQSARSYEQALRAGADPIIVNQRIGNSYSQLGRNSEAAEAYRACIAACNAAIASGRGNKSRLESVKATAEQALRVVQGG